MMEVRIFRICQKTASISAKKAIVSDNVFGGWLKKLKKRTGEFFWVSYRKCQGWTLKFGILLFYNFLLFFTFFLQFFTNFTNFHYSSECLLMVSSENGDFTVLNSKHC